MTSRQAYLDSHPSLNASMDDFEAREFSPTMPDMPSQHSGFRSNNSEYSERSSRRSYSPPAWRKAGSGWFKHQSLSPHRHGSDGKERSYRYHSADEDADPNVTAYRSAARIPLPASPLKGRSPTCSPEPISGANEGDQGGGDTTVVQEEDENGPDTTNTQTPTQSNCE